MSKTAFPFHRMKPTRLYCLVAPIGSDEN